MMFLIAEFAQPESVAAAVSALMAHGCPRDSIDVFSSRPVELPEALKRHRRASLFAVIGAILNGGLATGFIYYTQHDYPLITGGMPVFSGWATGVISFEMIMAGAAAGTVLAFLWESGWLRHIPGAPAPPVLREGSIFVRVKAAPDIAAAAGECLSRSGAIEIGRHQEAP